MFLTHSFMCASPPFPSAESADALIVASSSLSIQTLYCKA